MAEPGEGSDVNDGTPPLSYDLHDLPDDLISRITACSSGCWEWRGTRTTAKGYGRCYRSGRDVMAHRLIFTLLAGPIPAGLVLDHLCRNHPCVNPAHLDPVTDAENVRRRHQADRLGLAPVIPETAVLPPVRRPNLGTGRWALVPAFANYQVSCNGDVWSEPRPSTKGGLLKPNVGTRGYPKVTLRVGGQPRTFNVHDLVALAFIGPRPAGQVVRHLDDDKQNNLLSNLAYGTPAQNLDDSRRNGAAWTQRKTHCVRKHEYTEDNTYWYSEKGKLKRQCRQCNALREAARLRVYPSETKPQGICCTKGHELTAENSYAAKGGHIGCRKCQREKAGQRWDQRKAA